MHLLGLKPWEIDERMTVADFHRVCEWVDGYRAAMKET